MHARITIEETALFADPAGALFWPATKTLIVADLHLEKGSAFAAKGVPLPPYDTRATLDALQRLMRRYTPERVVCLGDSFHDKDAGKRIAPNDRDHLARMMKGLDWVWVLGNHDPQIPPELGGRVVPEIAARAHLDHLDDSIAAAMRQAGMAFSELDGIAVTGGPGLIGGVIVGVMMAKAIALAHNKPFIAVNHLEGHALTARLTDDVAFPYLLLLVSGGHCQLLVVEGVGRYRRLGATIDDAAGEAFDKAAKLMGLGFPGGPAVAAAAQGATAPYRDLPRPMKGRPDCNFSFSGLKTALRQRVDALAA